MMSLNLVKASRVLGLAAALIGTMVVPSLAEGFDGAGASAVPAWSQPKGRTPLAGRGAASVQDAARQNLLLRSGASGGGGQHG